MFHFCRYTRYLLCPIKSTVSRGVNSPYIKLAPPVCVLPYDDFKCLNIFKWPSQIWMKFGSAACINKLLITENFVSVSLIVSEK